MFNIVQAVEFAAGSADTAFDVQADFGGLEESIASHRQNLRDTLVEEGAAQFEERAFEVFDGIVARRLLNKGFSLTSKFEATFSDGRVEKRSSEGHTYTHCYVVWADGCRNGICGFGWAGSRALAEKAAAQWGWHTKFDKRTRRNVRTEPYGGRRVEIVEAVHVNAR